MQFHRRALLGISLLLPFATLDAEAGPRSRPIRTGQTTCFDAAGAEIPCAGTGQDGELKRGERRNYADEGNGTIRDKRAGLTWEKLSGDGTIHDRNNVYTWQEALERIDSLNEMSFAGFNDWRLPNSAELATLIDFGVASPAISAPFRTGCTGGCTVLTCSCMSSGDYWTSTTVEGDPDNAWAVRFLNGAMIAPPKTDSKFVRAVRGGAN